MAARLLKCCLENLVTTRERRPGPKCLLEDSWGAWHCHNYFILAGTFVQDFSEAATPETHANSESPGLVPVHTTM
jgi:hypothetical protein